MNRFARCAAGSAILGVLVAHAISWSPSQLLWPCHVASFAIALGLVLDDPRWLGAGVVFHVGEGIPAYVLDLIAIGETSVTSILSHVLPIACGGWGLWGKPLPRGIVVRAWLFQPFAMVAAYFLSDPDRNVMHVHKLYGPTASLFPSLWVSWIAYLVLSLCFLSIGWLALRRVWSRWR